MAELGTSREPTGNRDGRCARDEGNGLGAIERQGGRTAPARGKRGHEDAVLGKSPGKASHGLEFH